MNTPQRNMKTPVVACRLARGSIALAVWMLLGGMLGGCQLDVFNDSISTRVEVDLETFDAPVTASKRFRFERKVEEASGAVVDRAWVAVEAPADLDLSFLSRVQVYIVDPVTEELVLFVEGGGFKPGDSDVQLDVVYVEDVRKFVTDQRVNLEWVIEPNRLYRQDFSEELAALRFGIILEIDTE